MMKLWRSIILVCMLALFSGNILLHAQESTEEAEATEVAEAVTITASGSGIVNGVLEAVYAAADTTDSLEITTNGTTAGFADLCNGTSAVATAIRPINTEESLLCNENGVEYYELFIGFDIPTLVANPADSALSCLTLNQIDTVFAPSAVNQITNWSQVGLEETIDQELTAIVPADTTATYAAFENLVSGLGLRADASVADSNEALSTVASTAGAVAVVPYQAALNALDSVQIVNIDFGNGNGCLQPSAEAVEDGFYPLATSLLVYANRTQAEQLESLLGFLVSDASATAIAEAGFTPASVAQYELNRAILRGERDNQTVTADVAFEIPVDLSGSVSIGGALAGYRIADSISNRLSSTYQTFTTTRQFTGQQVDAAKLCDGSLDMLFSTAQFSDEQLQACVDAGISTATIPVGYQAVVLVSNNSDEFAACLTLEQIRTIWSITSTETVANWSDVADTFPERPLMLFSLREGNYLNDLLMSRAGATEPIRLDVAEQNTDPLYRAAATANVPGALTYMGWADYERVVNNNQQNIQLVAVDAGSGCVVPGLDTIENGSYALSQPVNVMVNQASLATKPVQSFLWSVFADENQSLYTAAGLTMPGRLADIRSTLLLQFADAEQLALEAESVEVTPEVTEEAP